MYRFYFAALFAALLAVGCGSDGNSSEKNLDSLAGDGGGGAGENDGGETPAVTCGELITQAQLTEILQKPVEHDESASPMCRFKPQGSLAPGLIQVFTRGITDYESMLAGARKDMGPSGEFAEPNTTGSRSFEFVGTKYGMKTAQIGFLDSSERYTVLVTLSLKLATLENLRPIAGQIDKNLSAKK